MPELRPEDWRDLCSAELEERLPRTEEYIDYYDGNHNLAFATSKFREAFGEQLEAFATNWCGLVVDSAVDRMRIEGFGIEGDDLAGDETRSWWQANRLDARSVMGHEEAIKCETAYLLVRPPEPGMFTPRFTVEHPGQVVVIHDPADPQIRLCAYKRYTDLSGQVEVVYLPDSITVFRNAYGVGGLGLVLLPFGVEMEPNVETLPNPLGVVPMVPLENNPSLLTGGVSDLKPAMALNDAANKFFADMLVASEFAAFPQRVAMGVELPPEGQEEQAQLKAALSRVWMFEAPDAKIDEFTAADLSNYTNAIEVAVQHLAAQTRTPPHYLLSKLMNLSGDALTAAESGLIHRVRRKFIDLGDGWEDGMQVGFLWQAMALVQAGYRNEAGLALWRSGRPIETQWGNPEESQPAVVADALSKKAMLNWPQEMLWREGGMSAQEVKQAKALLEEAGTGLTLEDVQLRVQAGIPMEKIWEEMGYSDTERAEMKRLMREQQQILTPPAPTGPAQQGAKPKQNGGKPAARRPTVVPR